MLEEAKRIRRWVRSQTPAKALADKGLILRACVLAQTRLSEAWLSQALEAVKEDRPIKAAAYFRTCLVNGLQEFVGEADRGRLGALYRRLEGLVPISDEQIRRLLASMSSRERGREQASSG